MEATIKQVQEIVSVLTEEQQQLLKDTINYGAWGDTDMENLTFAGFERKRYNEELEKRNNIIKELRNENKYLHKELKRHITLLSKLNSKNK